jgi:hypothetical protein
MVIARSLEPAAGEGVADRQGEKDKADGQHDNVEHDRSLPEQPE